MNEAALVFVSITCRSFSVQYFGLISWIIIRGRHIGSSQVLRYYVTIWTAVGLPLRASNGYLLGHNMLALELNLVIRIISM